MNNTESLNEFLKEHYDTSIDGASHYVLNDAIQVMDDFYKLTQNEGYNELIAYTYNILEEMEV